VTLEQILQILLEGVRNARRHGQARSGAIDVHQTPTTIEIRIDDNGRGFSDPEEAPWTIASRVAEFGGKLDINSGRSGAHLEIAIPST